MNVWHYAPAVRLPEMLTSGCLRPSNAGAANEASLLWFSSDQRWEPTAFKKLLRDDRVVTLTFEEQVKSIGCIRFGLDASDPRLLNWKAACQFAGTPGAARKAMEATGRRRDGRPENWFAVGTALSLTELVFQSWDDGWRDDEIAVVSQRWQELNDTNRYGGALRACA